MRMKFARLGFSKLQNDQWLISQVTDSLSLPDITYIYIMYIGIICVQKIDIILICNPYSASQVYSRSRRFYLSLSKFEGEIKLK